MDLSNVNRCIDELIRVGCGEHFAIRFGNMEEYFDVLKGQGVTADTHFDMASVTKIMATTPFCLIAFDEGKISSDTPVSCFFNCPKDKESLKIKHLLIHSIGFGYKFLNKPKINNDNIAETILNIPCEFPIGTRTAYSCPGFILLGKILEKVYNKPLDVLFNEKIASVLGLKNTGFNILSQNVINANDKESEKGLVNDYNCRHLGGVAGNAGIFSNLNDITIYIKMLLNNGEPIIKPETLKKATQNHTPLFSESRGLGFLYVDDRYSQTGKLFREGSFGHCGHTGQSVFVDQKNTFFAIILSDMTLKIHDDYEKVIKAREKIHNAIKKDLS